MKAADIRDLIAEHLAQQLQTGKVVALGNKVHVYVDEEEFEIVIRVGQKPDSCWKDTLDGF